VENFRAGKYEFCLLHIALQIAYYIFRPQCKSAMVQGWVNMFAATVLAFFMYMGLMATLIDMSASLTFTSAQGVFAQAVSMDFPQFYKD
jgi:hypothetical protein